VLRAAVRGAARRLADERTPLLARRRVPRTGDPDGDGGRVARRVLPLPVAQSTGAALVDGSRRAHQSARAAVGRRVAAELLRGARARRRRARPRPETYPRGRVIALIGTLSCDLKPGLPPSVGGGPYHGARALHRLRVPARIVARCAGADRGSLLPPLV